MLNESLLMCLFENGNRLIKLPAIGTCIIYLTDSNTIQICWYWPNTNTDTGHIYIDTINTYVPYRYHRYVPYRYHSYLHNKNSEVQYARYFN